MTSIVNSYNDAQNDIVKSENFQVTTQQNLYKKKYIELTSLNGFDSTEHKVFTQLQTSAKKCK